MHNCISSNRWISASLFRSSVPSVFILTKRNFIALSLTMSPPVLICENNPIKVPESNQTTEKIRINITFCKTFYPPQVNPDVYDHVQLIICKYL